jgi:flavin reductase (NADH)
MDRDLLRAAMAAWPSGVTIVACHYEGRVIATTMSAFLTLSLDPPQVLIAAGSNATVRPFLTPGASVGISVLAARHRRLAQVYADPFPVGPDPFADSGLLVADALLGLHCTVARAEPAADHLLVIADVQSFTRADGPPLLRYGRKYHAPDI